MTMRLALCVILCGLGLVASAGRGQSTAPDPGHDALAQAVRFDEGKEVPRDAAAAVSYYQSAAVAGSGAAHLRLGYLYETGDGVAQDYAAARQHYQAAVDAGVAAAHLRLALCYLEGWGGAADRARFVEEVRAAAEADYSPAQDIYATLCFIGFGRPMDRAEGVSWLERAAKKDDAEAAHRLGEHAEQVARLALKADLGLARTWYQLSAEQEYHASMRALARTFLVGDPKSRNFEIGKRWLQLATDNGDADAPYMLAVLEMLHVDAPEHDADKALVWLKLAAERGNYRAPEVLEKEASGMPLADAIRYVLDVPFEERYMQRIAARTPDAPTRPPVATRLVRPIYPLALHLSTTPGEAVIDFIVDTTGRVAQAKVIRATHPLFGERALAAVREWRFQPARKDGRLVKAHMQVPVKFTLDGDDLTGVDGMLDYARMRARVLGGAVEQDAADLRVAKPRRLMREPRLADGSPPPPNSRALVLLVLDEKGHPVRGHVLQSRPEELGASLLESALEGDFEPRIQDGKGAPSSVVLPFIPRQDGDRVLQSGEK